MNKLEVAKLLARAAVIDNRIVTEETIVVWHELLVDVDYERAVQIMNEHFKKSTEYFMPAHIEQGMHPRFIEREGYAPGVSYHPPAPEGKRYAVDVVVDDWN